MTGQSQYLVECSLPKFIPAAWGLYFYKVTVTLT